MSNPRQSSRGHVGLSSSGSSGAEAAELVKSLEYVNPTDESLCCAICVHPMLDPRVGPCGHSFCKECIDTWLMNRFDCPVCRGLLHRDGVRIVVALKNVVDRLQIYCPAREKGCKAILLREDLESHWSSCAYRRPVNSTSAECSSLASHSELTHVPSGSANLKKEADAWKCDALKYQRELETVKADLKEDIYQRQLVSDQLKANTAALESLQSQLIQFDYSYSYGQWRHCRSLVSLARFIAQNFPEMPRDISVVRLFNCIQTAYNNFRKVHPDRVMWLVATASASGWFTPNQMARFDDWVQFLADYDPLSDEEADYW